MMSTSSCYYHNTAAVVY